MQIKETESEKRSGTSIQQKGASRQNTSHKALLERMSKRWERIPPDERERIPVDGARNLDHYLYGAPKVSE